MGAQHILGWKGGIYVEKNEFCQAILSRRQREGYLSPGPLFNDLRAFNRDGYAAGCAGLVDAVIGGPPCQPFSVAGKRKGGSDARNLIPEALEAVRLLRPDFAVLENVPGLLSGQRQRVAVHEIQRLLFGTVWKRRETSVTLPGYFGRILAEMAEGGLDAAWRVLSAAECGAPHLRDRIWILAHPQRLGRKQGRPQRQRKGDVAPSGAGSEISHAQRRCGTPGTELTGWQAGADADRGGVGAGMEFLPDPTGGGRQREFLPVRPGGPQETPADPDGSGARDETQFSGPDGERGSGLDPVRGLGGLRLPTPTSSMDTFADLIQALFCGGSGERPTYREAREMFPTPTSSSTDGAEEHGDGGMNLESYVEKFPTPQARDYRSGKSGPKTLEKNSRPISETAGHGGLLNPDWVEWLMGMPIGWTKPAPLPASHFEEWLERTRNGTWWLEEPDIPRTTHSQPYRRKRLEAIGNAQVPLCLAAATVELFRMKAEWDGYEFDCGKH